MVFTPPLLSRLQTGGFLLPALVIVALWCLAASAGAQPPRTFFTQPDEVLHSDGVTTITFTARYGERARDAYLVPIATSGEFSHRIAEVMLRDIATGELLSPREHEPAAQFQRLNRDIENRVAVDDYGHLRQQRVARVAVDRQRTINIGSRRYEIASYTIAVHSSAERGAPLAGAHDSAIAEGLYRDLLDKVLLAPADLDRLPLQLPASPLPGPTEWQPDPALSPGHGWLAIPVEETGLYAIDGRWINEAGWDAASLRPEDLYIVRRGVQVPALQRGLAGANFAQGAGLIFYGVGNYSPETRAAHYFVGRRPEGISPLFFAEGLAVDSEFPEVTSVPRRHSEGEELEFKTQLGSFLSILSMTWVWKQLSEGDPLDIHFQLPGFVPEDSAPHVRATIHLYNDDPRGARGAGLRVYFGGERIQEFAFSRQVEPVRLSLPVGALREHANTLRLELYRTDPEFSASRLRHFYIESIDFQYASRISQEEQPRLLDFSLGNDTPIGPHRLRASGFRSPRQTIAVDVTTPDSPVLLSTVFERGVAYIAADLTEDARILLQESHQVSPAPAPRAAEWDALDGRDRSADILIVYHPLFREAVDLHAADLREAGYEVSTANVHSVYDSFSHGDLSTDGIRNFLAWSVYEWEGRRPFAAILYGDANGDGRGIARNDVPNYMPVTPIQAGSGREGEQFASDSWYSWLSGDGELADILIARIPSASLDDALAAVEKIKAYRKLAGERVDWGNRMFTVVDTGIFEDVLREVSDESVLPPFYNDLIVAADYPWEDNYYLPEHLIAREEDSKVSPLVTAAIEDSFNRGAAVVTFFGHGAPNLWSNQRFWFGGGSPNSDIIRLRNGERLPFVTSFTCNNATIDYPLRPWNICIAEDFLRQPNRGAISTFMPSGPGYLSNHRILASGFFSAWTEHSIRSHGLLAEFSRMNYQVRNEPDNHSQMYIFLGDPTLQLPEPDAMYTQREESGEFGGDLLITAVYPQPGDSQAPLVRQWNVAIERTSPRPAELVAVLRTPAGEIASRRAIPIPSSEGSHLVPLEIEAPRPGLYFAEIEIPHESGYWAREGFPSRRWANPMAIGDAGQPVRLYPEATRLVRNTARGSVLPLLEAQMLVAATNRPTMLEIAGHFRQNGIDKGSSDRTYGSLSAGHIAVPMTLPAEIDPFRPFEIHWTLSGKFHQEDETELIEEYRHTFVPGPFPDIVIVPDSIAVSPRPLSDGLTVFVEGRLRNDGQAPSSTFAMALFKPEDEERREPLRNITGPNDIAIRPVLPGEERAFRLRWDPHRNAGQYSIVAVADFRGELLEAHRENNVIEIPLNVRTKWELYTDRLDVARGEAPNEMVLTAHVGNRGETDARNVAVNFHRTQQQSDEDKLGEIVLDRVPANGVVQAVFRWTFTPAELNSEDTNPSFTIALRGSLQRVTSVSE